VWRVSEGVGPPTDVPLWVIAPVAIVEVNVELLVRVISSGACSCLSRSSTSGIGTYAPPPTVSSPPNDIFRKKSPLFFRLEEDCLLWVVPLLATDGLRRGCSSSS
jgi:hypothetical protein